MDTATTTAAPFVTECRITLPGPGEDPQVLCYCTLTLFGMLRVYGCRLIAGRGDRPHLAMPQHEPKSACPWCGFKRVRARDRHCSRCGARRSTEHAPYRDVLHDVCHPTGNAAREALERAVVDAYRAALEALPTVPTEAAP